MGVGVIPAARSSPVADPLETGPPLSSERHDLASMARVTHAVAAQREPFVLPERVLRQCGGSVPMRRQENESSASSYNSTLGLTYHTKGSERAPV